ncbi:MAG TPA: ferrochelatase [Chloroflexia bacterium]|nr:ferrochelatase [Chloroflexia bacterium]
MTLAALGFIVVMGILAGGMLALTLISPRRLQNIFGIGVLFGLVGGLAATFLSNLVDPQPLVPAIINNFLNLILSTFIGYAITTFFVLSYRLEPDVIPPDLGEAQAAQQNGPGKTAVLYFVAAEPEHYDSRVAARGFDTVDYSQALPPPLLRPLYLLDLKRKYDAVGTSPYRGMHFKLAQKVQDRLGKRYKVSIAFYNDHPTLEEAATEALRDGARRLIVLYPRLTNAPPSVKPADMLEELRLSRYGATVVEAAPLWNSELLPRLFVRRALAATEGQDRAMVGLILIGQGHPLPRRHMPESAENSALQRQNQELSFQKRVRQALIKAGFDDDNVVLAWLRWQHPTVEGAYAQLVAEGCRQIFWIGTGLVAEGITTLNDIPAMLKAASATTALETQALGPWNDDDVVAEALVEKVKQVAASVD